MAETGPVDHDTLEDDNRSLSEQFTISLVDAGGTSRGSENIVESYQEAMAEGERTLRLGEAVSFTINKRYVLSEVTPTDTLDGETVDEQDPFSGEANGETVPADDNLGGSDASVPSSEPGPVTE